MLMCTRKQLQPWCVRSVVLRDRYVTVVKETVPASKSLAAADIAECAPNPQNCDVAAGGTRIAALKVSSSASIEPGRCKCATFEESGMQISSVKSAWPVMALMLLLCVIWLICCLSFSLVIMLAPSPGAVQAESPPHLFVAGLHVPGGRIEVTRSCSDLPAVVKYMTAFVRANIDVPFAAVSLSDGSLLAPCRDIHNKHGSSGVAVPLGRPRHRGWRTLECGSGQLRPVVGSSTGTHCPPSATCSNNRCLCWAMVGIIVGCRSQVLCCQLAFLADLQYRQC